MRLDVFLYKNNYYKSRNKASEGILNGEVFYDGNAIFKPSFEVEENSSKITVKISDKSFVSVGGYKLDKALEDFNLEVSGFTCIDIGSSTGGFTDCLLNRSAKKVFAIDLNDDLLDSKLKDDNRVVFLLKNARFLTKNDFNESVNLIVGDLSFISLSLIFPVIYRLLEDDSLAVFLIKPQFELGERKKLKNGIITDKNLRLDIIKKVCDYAIDSKLQPMKITTAPIKEGKNVEYLIMLKKCENPIFNDSILPLL